MSWGQIKDSVFHLWLVGTVVASWSVTLEAARSNPVYHKHFSHRIQRIQ